MADPIRIWYTFGNHMHWVDMQWLWGYHVLPGSTFDMLRFCRETGAKGNVNFDGIGYEKMAAEAPEALSALRAAVEEGWIEPVGCSYGQPYGLFHGGESNIRQRVYGARTVMRLLGVRPKTFWEEEFDFFPQLPQMLRGCGFENASLYFQWTWHTPEVPFESSPVVWWEGIDGSRLLTATRNRLNLHQWPEDFQILLDELAESGPREVLKKRDSTPNEAEVQRWENEGGHVDEHPEGLEPLVLQWLELMPSPDWMCRSELMIPKLKDLLGDERFEVVFGTLGDYLKHARDMDVPVRRYGMHEVWHGLSLGKNGDQFRRKSRLAESMLLAAESQSATLSLFGRPYSHWDVYPTWEMEEGWRSLLMAQHHDNDECEGLCGHVGEIHYDTAARHAGHIFEASISFFHRVFKTRETAMSFSSRASGPLLTGWGLKSRDAGETWEATEEVVLGRRGDLEVRLCPNRPAIVAIGTRTFDPPLDFGFDEESWAVEIRTLRVTFVSESKRVKFDFNEAGDGVHVDFRGRLECANPGFTGARTLRLSFEGGQLMADTAYVVEEVRAEGTWLRKYPEGDWMTSPQWFESVTNPFVAQCLVNLEDAQGQLLVVQDRTRQWFRRDNEVSCVINLRDPWDEDRFETHVDFEMDLVPHAGLTRAEMWRRAQPNPSWHLAASVGVEGRGDLPVEFTALSSLSPGVEITAFYREAEDFASRGIEDYAGKDMGYPFIVRLVEFEGDAREAVLRVAGTVARAFRANLMGEVEAELAVEHCDDDGEWQALFQPGVSDQVNPNLYGKYSLIRLPMRGREIATLYLDIVEGRKQPRDLDAHRDVWATVHRKDSSDNP